MLDQNVNYWIISGLRHGIPDRVAQQDWSSVQIVAGYPNENRDMTLPTVALYRNINRDAPLELGSGNVIRADAFFASVFASRDGQRDDLGEYVKRLVDQKSKIFLDFNDGFDPQGGQSSLGVINFTFVGMFPVKELASQTRAGAHRMDIRFDTEYIYDMTS
jgi:hypothetical protein